MGALPVISPDVVLGGVLALLSLLTYGICMVLVSVCVRTFRSEPGSLIAAAACIPAGILISCWQLAFGEIQVGISAWAVVAFALAGIFSTYLGRWLVFKSIELNGPSGASALQSTSPLLTAVFAWVFLGEVIGWVGMLGITMAIVGLVSMSFGLQRRAATQPPVAAALASASSGRSMVWASLVVGVGSSVAYSGSHIFRGSAVRIWNEPLLGATIGAGAALLALLWASRTKWPEYKREILANRKGAWQFAGIGVLQFLAQTLVIASMKYIPVSVAALVSMCTPLVVVPISYFILRNEERLNGVMFIGILITLCGTLTSLVFAGRP